MDIVIRNKKHFTFLALMASIGKKKPYCWHGYNLPAISSNKNHILYNKKIMSIARNAVKNFPNS